jgi:hypothetical protein
LKIETMPLDTDHLLVLRTFSFKDRIQIRQSPDIAMQRSCYAMREYLFSQSVDGRSPRLMGYTNCVAAGLFHLRELAPSLDVSPPQ